MTVSASSSSRMVAGRIREALQAGDRDSARAEMERHIVGTIDVIGTEADAARRSG